MRRNKKWKWRWRWLWKPTGGKQLLLLNGFGPLGAC
jgi:hypothetical protein